MAKLSAIAWTKSTFNPWIGCTKVGPGCDACYAEALDIKRFSKVFDGGTKEKPVPHWGAGAPRHRTSAQNWHAPVVWNGLAGAEKVAGITKPWSVFCASLADVFDNEVPDEWRRDLWDLVSKTENLSWLLVTKRTGNVARMVPAAWINSGFPPHVRIIATIVNQEEADRDIPKLLALPCKNGISYEPALGPIEWNTWPQRQWLRVVGADGAAVRGKIEWIIVGGESAQAGHEARVCQIEWMRSTRDQCAAAGVPLFVKQFGAHCGWNGMQNAESCWPGFEAPRREDTGRGYWRVHLKDRAGADPAEWPESLRVREFPA